MELIIDEFAKLKIHAKCGNDELLKKTFKTEIINANKIKIIQMKLGEVYENLSSLYGFKKVKKIDLINHKKKYLVELKSSDNTDNSASRKKNIDKLKEYQKYYPDYSIYYVCLNTTLKYPQNKIIEDNVHFLSGIYAKSFLFGKDTSIILSKLENALYQIKLNNF